MGNPERSNKALRRKKTLQKIIAVTSVVLVILLAAVLLTRKTVRAKYGSRSNAQVQTAQVTTGSIRTTVSGTGALTSENILDVKFPSGVTIDTVYAKQGDGVEEGTMLASVNTGSVLTAMADVQSELNALDKKLVSASKDTVSSTISAGVSGRIKGVYAEKEDDVAAVMYEHGALALISLDGYMAVDLEGTDYQVGDEVTVMTSDEKTYTGTVDSIAAGKAVVLITDNGPLDGDTVTVDDLHTGTLYVHSPLKVTGYAGTISNVQAKENAAVYRSSQLFSLKDTAYSANYDALLEERADYEELYQKLVKLYMDGGILSPIRGTVETIIDPDEDTAAPDASSLSSALSSSQASSTQSPGLLEETLAAAIDPNETMSATITVDETDILSLSVGQEAVVTVDSIGEQTYPGIVEEIDTNALSASGVTMYTAKITMDKAEHMLSGMTADVSVTIEGVENAMLVPYDAVHKTSASAYVYTTYDEETDTLGGITEVTIGINNGKMMEITGGLNPGDTIYYTPREQTFSFGGFTVTTGGKNSGNRGNVPGGMPGGGMPAHPMG